MECKVWNAWSAECGVQSVECEVWSGEWGVQSVECGVRSVKRGVSPSAMPATQNDMSTSCDTSKRHVCATFPIGTATSASRQSCTSHTWNVTKCHATQNDMTTSVDTLKKTRFCNFSHRHGNFSLTRVAHLTHVECHKVPCHAKRHEHIV